MIIRLVSLLCVVSLIAPLYAQRRVLQPTWQPSPGHTQELIWPGAVPDARPAEGPEIAWNDEGFLIAGRSVLGVGNVSNPTMTVYSPNGNNTRVAVVVFPGGGYQALAIDLARGYRSL